MLDEVIKVLSNYHYKVDYTSYHKKSDIIKYQKQEKNINQDKLLTILTKDNLVVGRIHNLKEGEGTTFNQEHLEKVIALFIMFQLPHREEIIKKLKEIPHQ